MKWRSLIDYLLYSHLYIATCAVLMTMQTLLLFNILFSSCYFLLAFIFVSTLLFFCAHRLVSLDRVIAVDPEGRFKKINVLKSYLQIQAIVASLLGLYLFAQLKFNTQLALVLPALLSIAYVLPIMNGFSTRLRDVNYIKIFLIAIVWAFITVVLPHRLVGEMIKRSGQIEKNSKQYVNTVQRIIAIFSSSDITVCESKSSFICVLHYQCCYI